MSDQELVREIIKRSVANLSQEKIEGLVSSMPVHTAHGAMEFEPVISLWFDTACVVNNVNVGWELSEIVRALRTKHNQQSNEVNASENI